MTHVIEVPFHIGDFLSGTMHMDATEVGAYWLLIIAHYQAGMVGLPDDDKRLAMIAKVTTKAWNRMRPTLEQKFEVEDGFWRHKKVEEVLQKVFDKSAAAKAKSLKRWNTCYAAALPQQCNGNANHKPPNQVSIKKKKINKKENYTEKFKQFWELYPRHRRGNQENAWRAWAKAVTEERATEDEILRGVRSYAASNPGEYAKGAAAWLNDDRWNWQTTDSAVKLEEARDEWPPWKKDFAMHIGDKAVYSWFKNTDFRDGVLIVQKSFQEQKIRELYSDKLQKLGLTEIRTTQYGHLCRPMF